MVSRHKSCLCISASIPWLCVSFVVTHILYVFTVYYIDPDQMSFFLLSQASVSVCQQAIGLNFQEVCNERMLWAKQSFLGNIVRLVVLDHIKHVSDIQSMLRYAFGLSGETIRYCEHGTICRYQITKVMDSITSSLYFAIPMLVIMAIIYIGVSIYISLNLYTTMCPTKKVVDQHESITVKPA
jgi:hypothetical protein